MLLAILAVGIVLFAKVPSDPTMLASWCQFAGSGQKSLRKTNIMKDPLRANLQRISQRSGLIMERGTALFHSNSYVPLNH